ncbi:MAG TPA: hypothetical protein VKR42_12185 [Ktedonobacteraceae bacterium]|nr:hypothetical protein [Ktedonobacteraceae bacterium]
MDQQTIQNLELLSDVTALNEEIPLACTLSESDLAARKDEINPIFQSVQQVKELADGYALSFPGTNEWANRLIEFINFERVCCQFFTFALVFEPGLGATWMQVRGPEGVKGMVEEMINR